MVKTSNEIINNIKKYSHIYLLKSVNISQQKGMRTTTWRGMF